MIEVRAYKTLNTQEGKMPLDISFRVEQGQFMAIYGKSGAGKTTLLRIVAGLTPAESCFVKIGDDLWDDSGNKFHLPVQKRSIGFVFQDYALFPNLTVIENLEFAVPKNGDRKIVSELIDFMELGQLQQNKPGSLSGGQQQRVALARAIARKPKILLLDEPLAALDDDMRFKLQEYIVKAHQFYHLTTVLVSHNLPEIFRLADTALILEDGKINRHGKPADIFREPTASGRFNVTGEIIDITQNDIVYIVSVQSMNTIIKLIATKNEINAMQVGQKVLVVSKVFNPTIHVLK